MPHGVHNIPAKTYRPEPELHARAKAAVAEVDSTLNAHITAFLQWLVRDTDELPARPANRVPRTGEGPAR
jgi:hypothetical protein